MLGLFDWTQWESASPIIRVHVIVAVLGFLVGTLIIVMRRGTMLHRWMGRGFAVAAMLTALTSFFINEIQQWGSWSWIHLLSILVVYSTITGVLAIRRGNMKGHMTAMISIYLGGFVVAGGFTFLPGRRMYEIFIGPVLRRIFSDQTGIVEVAAWAIPVVGVISAIWVYRRALVLPLRKMSRN